MTQTDMVASTKPGALDAVTREIPLGRFAEISEIVQAAVVIAENDYFTGRCIEVDGGLRF
jgi:3-oxoacyl-[acyl-carrier protein] reductase